MPSPTYTLQSDAETIGQRPTVLEASDENSNFAKWRMLAVAAIYALCLGSTFISYRPCVFRWDNSEYFARSIAVSRAFWSGDLKGLAAGMISIRPPAMTLMGLPWGSLLSQDTAGKCFITLAAAIGGLVATCQYLLLRIGMRPILIVLASVCVCVSLGPYPWGSQAHLHATGFEADSLFAWVVLAAALLIPYEMRTHSTTASRSALRGILWGLIFSLGVMIKLSFLFFVVPFALVLLCIKLLHDGLRSALAALVTCGFFLAPSAIYLLRWGRLAWQNARGSSFGAASGAFYVPLTQFIGQYIRESPGVILSLLLTASATMYFLLRRRSLKSWIDFVPLGIVLGFAIVSILSPNRQIRYLFPAIIALPFLAGVLISRGGPRTSRRSAAFAAGLTFCGLLLAGLPTRHRPEWKSLSRCEAVLAISRHYNAEHIVLATDSPTLNEPLMMLASLFSSTRSSISTLVYDGVWGVPIERDLSAISVADLVIFQDRAALAPAVTNKRIAEYESYAKRIGNGPIRVANDVSVYQMRYR